MFLIGSLPINLNNNFYSDLSKISCENKCYLIVDPYGPTLVELLKQGTFAIKPNITELELTTNSKFKNDNDIISAANKLIKMSAKNVLVSKGPRGAILINKNEVFTFTIPKQISC